MSEATSSAKARLLMLNATEEMSSRDIPVSPENYTVWYTYAEESRSDLNDHIDQLIQRKAFFSEEVNTDIYHRFFGTEFQRTMEEIRQGLAKIINNAGQGIGTAGEIIRDFESALGTYSRNVKEADNPRELGVIVNQMAQLSRSTTQTTHSVGRSMTSLADEIDSLRDRIDELSKEAHTDQLTTVGNRRIFEMQFQKLYQEAKHMGYGFTLLLLDIDHFKKFNDTYGHAVGDRVLRFVGKALKAGVKGQDMVSRYGGEEFVILLPATELRDGTTLADSLLKRISSKNLSTGKNHKTSIGNITISAGVASYSEGDTMESLFKRADDCLYRAKETGRNRVVGETDLL